VKIIIHTFHSPYTSERVGGAETSLKLIAEEFAARGHEVTFFSSSRSKSFFGFKKTRVNQVEVIVFYKFKLKLLNTYAFKKFSKFIKRNYLKFKLKEIDIVHTYNNISIVRFYTELKNDFKFKLVVRMAGLKLFEDFASQPKLISEYEQYFKHIDLYNFISTGLVDLVSNRSKKFNLNVNFEPFFVQDIGVSLAHLPVKNEFKKENNSPFQIVMASRFSIYQKRQDLLIEAMVYLKHSNIELTLIGEGRNLKELKRKCKDLNVEENVNFKPFKANIWGDLKDYDLLVHACDYEGLSKIIIESMGVGLPVLASNVLPLSNYIQDGINGFLVNNEPIEWANKIKAISQNLDLDKISVSSKAFILENYNSQTNIEIYENQFESI
jgi:glycosyltransferase involved in cell wall biosynthesis